MLSIEKCKKILEDNNEKYSEEEIQVILELLYNFSSITILKKNEKDDE